MCRLNGVSDIVLMAVVVLPLFNSFAIIVGTILLIEHLSTGQKALTTRKGRGLALCRQNPYCRRHDNRQAPAAPPGLPLLRHRPTTTQAGRPRPRPEVLFGEVPAGRSEPPAKASASARAAVLHASWAGNVVTLSRPCTDVDPNTTVSLLRRHDELRVHPTVSYAIGYLGYALESKCVEDELFHLPESARAVLELALQVLEDRRQHDRFLRTCAWPID
jgi:hypothetical protein